MAIEDEHSIYQFQGPYRFLSNFYICPEPIIVDHEQGGFYIFPTVEHAYQAYKTHDYYERQWVANQPTAKLAKRAGRQITLRGDWSAVCLQVMSYFVTVKFKQQILLQALLQTDPKYLYEGNQWGDRFWGVDLQTLEGDNHLGRILMDIRQSAIHSLP